MSATPEERDLDAAEYVLGVLTAEERRAIEAEALRDADLAEAIRRWERRLAPLADMVPPIAPPAELWARIEADVGRRNVVSLPRRGLWNSVALWRSATAGAVALAAALAGILVLRAPPPAQYVAALAPADVKAAGWVAETRPDGAIVLTALAQQARPAGKDLELWALPAGAQKPVSLGVVPASGRMVVPAASLPREGLQLMISVEPLGGSPTGQPTGPVVFGGRLTIAD